MHADTFKPAEAARIIGHPDLRAAYASWREIVPLLGHADREHVGNLLGWSRAAADRPLGSSRDLFQRALPGSEETVDDWMAFLGETSAADFAAHHATFLRNAAGLGYAGGARDRVAAEYVRLALDPSAGHAHSRLHRDMPESVILEITRSCNFACTMCSMTGEGFLAERTMPVELFGELVRVLSPAAQTLRVNGYGETSIVPDLHRWLGCLDAFGFKGMREIITNLSAPDPVYFDLFDLGFVILVSWDAAEAGLFDAIRRGARFADLRRRLAALGTHARTQPERLGLLCTVQEMNLHEVVPVTRLASEVGAGLVIFNMVKEPDGSPWIDRRIDEVKAVFHEADRVAARLGIAVRIPDHAGRHRLPLRQVKRSSGTFCDRPWREILVRWDTEVTVCNMFNPWSYGVLRPPGIEVDTRMRFSRLWNGPNARLFRQMINSEAPHPYCKECYFLYP